jgi:hypothetical protein
MSSYDEQLAVFNAKKILAAKIKAEQDELDRMPSAIKVTYIGENSPYYHKGRSKKAKRDPYCFNKDVPKVISEPADVKYFMIKSKVEGSVFETEVISDEELLNEEVYDEVEDEFAKQIAEQKRKVEQLEIDQKLAKQERIKAKKKALEKAKKTKVAKKKLKAKKDAEEKTGDE